jgi:hydroxymethylbilane synthase
VPAAGAAATDPVPGDSSALRLGTRGSQLALWQANAVAARIAATGGPPCRLVIIKTSGDRLQQAPLSELGGKRLFVKEIDEALLANEIDLAVHSSKDMPARLPEGLAIGGVLPREDPSDAVVLPQGRAFLGLDAMVAELGSAPSLGTGSVRRIAQLTLLFPSARFTPIRGNLDTRLRKLDAGDYDALILAAAGLRRLGFAWRVSTTLPAAACLPAPGQGIVAIEVREHDTRVIESVAAIHDNQTGDALAAERAVVDALGGGCQMPLGALATAVDDSQLELVAAVFSLDGSRALRASARAPRREARALGAQVGAMLLAEGAGALLAQASGHERAGDVASAALSDE